MTPAIGSSVITSTATSRATSNPAVNGAGGMGRLPLDSLALGLPQAQATIATFSTAVKAVEDDPETHQGTVHKLETGIALLQHLMSGGSTDALQLMMRAVSAQNDTSRAELDIKTKNDQIEQAAKQRAHEIQKQLEAEDQANSWGFWGKFLQVVSTAISVVASVFTGGVAIAAAVLSAAALISSLAGGPQWLSIGLSVAGMLCGGVGALAQSGAAVAKTVIDRIVDVTQGAIEVARAGTTVGEGVNRYEAANCEADLQRIANQKTEAEQQRDKLQKLTGEASEKINDLLLGMLRLFDLRHAVAAEQLGQRAR